MGIGLRVLKKNLFTTFVFNLFEIGFELVVLWGEIGPCAGRSSS